RCTETQPREFPATNAPCPAGGTSRSIALWAMRLAPYLHNNRAAFPRSGGTLRRVTGQLICVIEDEEVIASAIAARLRAEGFAVEVAHDGPEGVALCDRARPDLVVLDLMLP